MNLGKTLFCVELSLECFTSVTSAFTCVVQKENFNRMVAISMCIIKIVISRNGTHSILFVLTKSIGRMNKGRVTPSQVSNCCSIPSFHFLCGFNFIQNTINTHSNHSPYLFHLLFLPTYEVPTKIGCSPIIYILYNMHRSRFC